MTYATAQDMLNWFDAHELAANTGFVRLEGNPQGDQE